MMSAETGVCAATLLRGCAGESRRVSSSLTGNQEAHYLFAADALLPKPSVIGIVSGAAPSPIRIQSERKGPEAIVFDTTQPTITPSTAASPEATVTDASPSWSAVRKSFAQVV